MAIGFWIFMLAMDLLIPLCMIVCGLLFLKRPPKNINSLYGYRTARSMRNRHTWDFAHAYSGRFWYRAGWAVLAPSVVWMLPVLHRDIETIGKAGGVLTALQLVPFLAVIPATERALKREFDELGRKR